MTECQSISFTDLDLSNETYRITMAEKDLSAMALSISTQGMLTPPSVIEIKDNTKAKFAVVSGFRRLKAARSLGHEQVLCRVYPIGEEAACARLAVTENAFSRELGPGELARAVRLVSAHMDSDTLAEQSLGLFNTQLNQKIIDTLITVSCLTSSPFELMDSGQLSMKAARALTALPEADADLMLGLFSSIKASSGKQMEILTWAQEICAREKIGLDRLLSDNTIRDALDPDGSNRDMGAAANRVRTVLYSRRFPELDTARTCAMRLVRELGLPKGVRMTVPENFESMVYSLSLSFTSPKDYEDAVKSVLTLSAHPSFQKLLDR